MENCIEQSDKLFTARCSCGRFLFRGVICFFFFAVPLVFSQGITLLHLLPLALMLMFAAFAVSAFFTRVVFYMDGIAVKHFGVGKRLAFAELETVAYRSFENSDSKRCLTLFTKKGKNKNAVFRVSENVFDFHAWFCSAIAVLLPAYRKELEKGNEKRWSKKALMTSKGIRLGTRLVQFEDISAIDFCDNKCSLFTGESPRALVQIPANVPGFFEGYLFVKEKTGRRVALFGTDFL